MALETRVEHGTASQKPEAMEDSVIDYGKNLLRIDLACGHKAKDGYIGVDKFAKNVDVRHDLMQFPWPIEDESVYEFYCSHFVEHIPIVLSNGDYGLNKFMAEVYRCLMPSGTILIVAPWYMSKEAFQDPTHCRYITDATFTYYNQSEMRRLNIDHYNTLECNFETVHLKVAVKPDKEPMLAAKSDLALEFAKQHYMNVGIQIEVMLRKMPLLEIQEE